MLTFVDKSVIHKNNKIIHSYPPLKTVEKEIKFYVMVDNLVKSVEKRG